VVDFPSVGSVMTALIIAKISFAVTEISIERSASVGSDPSCV
jgi:hypothetical protein